MYLFQNKLDKVKRKINNKKNKIKIKIKINNKKMIKSKIRKNQNEINL